MKTDGLKLRASVIFFIFLTLYLIIIANLYYIQIYQADFFNQLGLQQYHVTQTKTPPRALIYDRTGRPLAINQDCISAFILPKQLKSRESLEPFLQKHFPHAYEQLRTPSNKQFIYIKRHLSSAQQQLITDSALADIQLLHEPHRFYTTHTTAPVIGITDIDNKGLFGIELQYNNVLAGIPTVFCLDKDARSGYFHFKKETTNEGKEGTPVYVTINSNLQFLVHEAVKDAVKKFDAVEGYALVMNPQNGEILAMVTYPHFDPNNTTPLDLELTKNKVVTEAYELGSVMKTFAALAALQEGVVAPDELIDCKNVTTTYIDGRKINTWAPHGVIPFSEVIARSNNIGIAIVAKRLDEKLFDHYSRLGFGKKTGINFPGENKGFVNPPHQWSKQSIISLSYGYEVSATLLQLACSFCIIANDGYAVKPVLVLNEKQSTHTTEKLYATEHIQALKNILTYGATYGTARRAHIDGYNIMCKTGTANMLVDGQYQSDKNLFTCAGIVEKDAYQRVIVTFIKQAKGTNLFASTVAAPLFERVAQRVIINDKAI
jgi:cell division protein FtsI/penicillin-binding protein 2